MAKAKTATKKASVPKALVKAVKAAVVPPKGASRAKKNVFFFGAGKADGDVKAVLTARSAAILAAGLTAAALLVSLLRGGGRRAR